MWQRRSGGSLSAAMWSMQSDESVCPRLHESVRPKEDSLSVDFVAVRALLQDATDRFIGLLVDIFIFCFAASRARHFLHLLACQPLDRHSPLYVAALRTETECVCRIFVLAWSGQVLRPALPYCGFLVGVPVVALFFSHRQREFGVFCHRCPLAVGRHPDTREGNRTLWTPDHGRAMCRTRPDGAVPDPS